VDIFDAKVVNNEAERDRIGAVFEETGGDAGRDMTTSGKVKIF